jgi:hypothetical protein
MTLCKVCNDHGRKGERAGFLFEGQTVVYNCFNCGLHATYDPAADESLSRDMQKVLTAYGIESNDWKKILYDDFVARSNGSISTSEKAKVVDHEPRVLTMPPMFYPLIDNPDDEIAQYAIEYLRDERTIDWQAYPFYLCDASYKHPDTAKWVGRLIIPIYRQNKLIFWIGRDLSDLRPQKYLSPAVEKDRIMYGYDEISKQGTEPLYIFEGWFDAFHAGGVAVFGRMLSESHVYWLNQTSRPKVVVPDKFGNGKDLAMAGLSKGWAVATPDIGNCKDVDEAIRKYGKLYVLNSLREHTYTGLEARTRLELYCE